jgi:hypothetical protein
MQVHFWIGRHASSSTITAVTIQAVNLRGSLGRGCSTAREDEGGESPQFLHALGGSRLDDYKGPP